MTECSDLYAIGTTLAGITNLLDLTMPIHPPATDYRPYAQLVPLADGSQRGIGLPTAEWRWGYLEQSQRDQLRSFCPNESAAVYIRTRTLENSDAYKYFSAVMLWPVDQEERDSFARPDFAVRFVKLVEVTP